jgi:uncharacterized spore protein YtfJ
MTLAELLEEAKETIGSKGVFGTPYEKNGVTVIPAARIVGGAGGGEGPITTSSKETDGADEAGVAKQTSSGAGFGVSGQPTGAFVIKGNDVSWVPAVDVNRMIFGFQVVLIAFLFAWRSIASARAKPGLKSD